MQTATGAFEKAASNEGRGRGEGEGDGAESACASAVYGAVTDACLVV